jgi:hypothetical protein
MLIYRVLSAIAAAALGALVVMLLPGFSPTVEASTSAPVAMPAPIASSAPLAKADRLELAPATDCSQQAWPYFDANCLRNRTPTAGQARTVRRVSTDRLPQ